MKFNAKKNIVRLADRKTRVFLVLLVAKENDLSLSLSLFLSIYIHTIYYNMFGPWLGIVLFVNMFGALLASLGRIF